MNLTFFMLLRATPAWLAKPRPERRDYLDQVVKPLFARFPDVKLRYFDAEYFSTRCSDIALWETRDVEQYAFLIDALRDTAFFGLPYFEMVEIIPSFENGYLAYDADLAKRA